MAEAGVGTVPIRPDMDGFKNFGKSFDGPLNDADHKFSTAFKKIALGAGAAFAAVGVGKILGDSISAASDLNETVSKSNTIFGEFGPSMLEWASKSATLLGQSKQQALDAAGSFGNMFTQIGIGTGKAAEMSSAMTELASDFASFHNADISEVLNAQQAAFRGEYDAVQKFVPTINAAAVEQRALALTGKKTTKELTAQDKALASYKLMMEGAGAAMGDFGRTSDGLANKQRIMNAHWQDAKAQLGKALLPIMSAVVGFVSEKMIPAFQRVVEAIAPFLDGLKAAFSEGGIGGAISYLWTKFEEAWPKIQSALGTLLGNLGSWIMDSALPQLATWTGDLGVALWKWVQDATPPFLVKLGEWLQAFGGWVINTALPKLGEWALEFAGKFVDWIVTSAIPWLLEHLPKWMAEFANWVLTTAIPKVIEFGSKMAAKFVEWIVTEGIPKLAENLPKWLAKLADWVATEAIPKLVTGMKNMATDSMQALFDGLGEKVGDVLTWFASLPQTIMDKLAGLPGKFLHLGADMMQKLIDGIKSLFGKVTEWVGKVLDALNPLNHIPGTGGGPGGGNLADDVAKKVQGRAAGGPVDAFQMYRGGEKGFEVLQGLSGRNYFIPPEAGNVIPNSQLTGGPSAPRPPQTIQLVTQDKRVLMEWLLEGESAHVMAI